MLAKCIGEGFRSARKNPALTMLLWFWSLLLASMAAFPAWFWLAQGFDLRPESDRLLSGFNFRVFGELAQYDRSPVRGVIFATLFCVLALAILVNPLVSGGLLGVLRGEDKEPSPMRGFWHNAGVSFWRFFRLLLYAAVTAIALFAAVSGALSPIIDWLDERPWEPGFLLGRFLSMAALIVTGVWILLALDFARVRTAVDESRRTLRNWLWSLIFVWRHPVLTFGLMGSAALLFVIMAGIYTAIASGLRPSTWAVIVLIVIFQQILMCFRSSLRVGLVAAELACYRQLFPPASVPEASAEPVFIELPPVAEPPTSPPAPGQVPPEAPDPL